MSVSSVVYILAREPEFNQVQAMTFCMVAQRAGLVILSAVEFNEMKSRMDICPGHPVSEFVR